MKCPECGGTGELEVKVGLMDCPVDCIFCDGTGEVPDKQEEE